MSDVRAGFRNRRADRQDWPSNLAGRRSGVLILMFETEDGPQVILIERSRHNGTHKGDIAFPGGVLQPGETAWQAALREAYEEIGVTPDDVELIAPLDVIPIDTGFVIRPFVAAVPTRPDFRIDQSEIERVFSVPLNVLVQPEAHWYERWGPHQATLPFFAIEDGVGWGTTAAILIELLSTASRGRAV